MTMREKMARAMFAVADDPDFGPDTAPSWLYERYLAMADAALAALEEPTEAMLEAGWDAFQANGTGADIFRAMIVAAKGE